MICNIYLAHRIFLKSISRLQKKKESLFLKAWRACWRKWRDYKKSLSPHVTLLPFHRFYSSGETWYLQWGSLKPLCSLYLLRTEVSTKNTAAFNMSSKLLTKVSIRPECSSSSNFFIFVKLSSAFHGNPLSTWSLTITSLLEEDLTRPSIRVYQMKPPTFVLSVAPQKGCSRCLLQKMLYYWLVSWYLRCTRCLTCRWLRTLNEFSILAKKKVEKNLCCLGYAAVDTAGIQFFSNKETGAMNFSDLCKQTNHIYVVKFLYLSHPFHFSYISLLVSPALFKFGWRASWDTECTGLFFKNESRSTYWFFLNQWIQNHCQNGNVRDYNLIASYEWIADYNRSDVWNMIKRIEAEGWERECGDKDSGKALLKKHE